MNERFGAVYGQLINREVSLDEPIKVLRSIGDFSDDLIAARSAEPGRVHASGQLRTARRRLRIGNRSGGAIKLAEELNSDRQVSCAGGSAASCHCL
jgi:hypothetical protein